MNQRTQWTAGDGQQVSGTVAADTLLFSDLATDIAVGDIVEGKYGLAEAAHTEGFTHSLSIFTVGVTRHKGCQKAEAHVFEATEKTVLVRVLCHGNDDESD